MDDKPKRDWSDKATLIFVGIATAAGRAACERSTRCGRHGSIMHETRLDPPAAQYHAKPKQPN